MSGLEVRDGNGQVGTRCGWERTFVGRGRSEQTLPGPGPRVERRVPTSYGRKRDRRSGGEGLVGGEEGEDREWKSRCDRREGDEKTTFLS